MNNLDLEQLVQLVTTEVIKKINLEYEPIKDQSNTNAFIKYLLEAQPNSIFNNTCSHLQQFKIIEKLLNIQLQISKFIKDFTDHNFSLLKPNTLYAIDLINENLDCTEFLFNLKASQKIQFPKDRTIVIQTKKNTTEKTSTTILDLFIIFIHLIDIWLLINFNNHKLIRFEVTENQLEYELRKPIGVNQFYTTTIDFTYNKEDRNTTAISSLTQLTITINDLIYDLYNYNKETILDLLNKQKGDDKNI